MGYESHTDLIEGGLVFEGGPERLPNLGKAVDRIKSGLSDPRLAATGEEVWRRAAADHKPYAGSLGLRGALGLGRFSVANDQRLLAAVYVPREHLL